MARIKGAVNAHKKRRKIMKLAKGYYGSKSKQYRAAQEQVMRSLRYAYIGRKQRKRAVQPAGDANDKPFAMNVCKAPAKRCGLQVKHTGQFLRCKGSVCADVAPKLRHCSGIGLKGSELIRANIRVYERLIRKWIAAGEQFAARGDGAHERRIQSA